MLGLQPDQLEVGEQGICSPQLCGLGKGHQILQLSFLSQLNNVVGIGDFSVFSKTARGVVKYHPRRLHQGIHRG